MNIQSLLQLNTQQLLLFWGISVVLTYILFVTFIGFYGKEKLSLFYGKIPLMSALQIDFTLFIIFMIPFFNILYFVFVFVNREEIIKDLYIEIEIDSLASEKFETISERELYKVIVEGTPVVKEYEIDEIIERYEEKIK